MSNNQPEILTISALLNKDKYIIPLYQRNYAWTEVETIQLLQDIWDKFKEGEDSNYYIGTLVVDKRNNGDFEIIDGQQRYTTLTLIHAVTVIKNLLKASGTGQSNLDFESRKEISDFIEELFLNYETAKNKPTDHISLNNIIKAVREIEKFFEKEDIKGDQNYAKFIYNNVKIIRINVPEGTDVNHYFEIMNNRGEQLECHEILKAKFIESIEIISKNEVREIEYLRKEFNLIWEACSQMDKHIQLCFDKNKRKEIFGDDYTKTPKGYLNDYLMKLFRNTGIFDMETSTDSTLENILIKSHEIKKSYKQESDSTTESKFKAIIDFPNFLLQILKIQNKDENVSLDDKKLLDEFGYTNKKGRTLPDAIEFANLLLYYRTLFDKYIIKRDEDEDNWALKQAQKESNGELVYKNTKFGKDDSDSEKNSKDICMIQSMLHVSFPGNSYKNWLQEVLLFFKEKINNSIYYNDFRDKLKKISKDYYDKYSENGNGFNRGIHTERFIFNYLDYILWRKYIEEVSGNTISENDSLLCRIASNRDKFNSFRFRQNNSVEHLHPQSKVDELAEDKDFDDKKKILDNFGNLCLISGGSNSKYNDYNFSAKKEQFLKRKETESLKQIIMFSYEKWNTEEIKKHGKEMAAIIQILH